MNEISDEIKTLQLRIVELEKKKLEMQDINKNTLVNHNLDIINDLLIQKKNSISNIICRHPDAFKRKIRTQELITYLEPIFNILKNIDERITKLENNKN